MLKIGLFLTCILFTSALGKQRRQCNPLKIIIDTDGGVDDGFAIAYFLNSQKMFTKSCAPKLLAITTVYGNTDVTNATHNILRLLNQYNKTDIPIFRGSETALLMPSSSNYYFGYDGFGDVFSGEPDNKHLIKSEHAVNALLRIVQEHNPGTITLVSLGPMTNIALASKLDTKFVSKLKNIYFMGGSAEGRGNLGPAVEFNILCDPEAVHIILNSTSFGDTSVYMLPWEAVIFSNVTYDFRKNVLGQMKCPTMEFLNSIEHLDEHNDGDLWDLSDAFIPAVLLEPQIVSKLEPYYVIVNHVSDGPLRGMMTVDYDHRLKTTNKINIIFRMNPSRLKKFLVKYFKKC